MKSLMKSLTGIAAIFLAVLMILPAFALNGSASGVPETFDNPVIKTDADGNIFFSADPSVRVFDGKMYMYCSHDVFPANRCCNMDNYHVFTSSDGQNWKDEGQILSSYDLSWGHKGGYMWAPDCEKINGKYYFFYPHMKNQDDFSSWVTAVAVSDSPVGPFRDLGPIAGVNSYDPNVLVCSAGVYLYWGGSQTLYGCKLSVSGDRVALDGSTVNLTQYCTGFQEGAWCFEKDGKFYLTYAHGRSSSNTSPTLGYSIGSSPLGRFTYKGDMLAANPGSNMDTSHGCVVNYNGVWLMFYHNMALSGFECLRSVCASRMSFNADGTINQVIPAANTAPVTNKTEPEDAVKYPINRTDWIVGNDGSGSDPASATFETNGSITNVGNLHVVGAFTQTSVIDGGDKGGKAVISFQYSSLNEYAAIYPTVNGTVYSPAPAAPNGSWNNFINYTQTTIELKPCMNTLKISGGRGGVNISAVYIRIIPVSDRVENLSAGSVTASGAHLTWSAYPNALKYRLFREKDGKWVFIKDTYALSAEIAGLSAETEYRYAVRPISESRKYIGEYSEISFKTLVDENMHLTASDIGTGELILSWNEKPSALKYRVFIKESDSWKALRDVYALSYRVTGLERNTQYEFAVRPISTAKKYMSDYQTASAKTLGFAFSAENITPTGARLTWSSFENAAKYRIFRRSNSDWEFVKDTYSFSYSVSGLSVGTAYEYAIRPISAQKKYMSDYMSISFTTK